MNMQYAYFTSHGFWRFRVPEIDGRLEWEEAEFGTHGDFWQPWTDAPELAAAAATARIEKAQLPASLR